MLRLTTNVTVSPASSARSSSAAQRISSITAGRVSANSAVSSVGAQRAARRARARTARGATSSASVERPPAGPIPRRGMNDQYAALDHVEHRPRDPLRVDVLGVHAQPLGQRQALRAQPLAHLRSATGTGARARCGRRWRSVRRDRWRRRATSSIHQSDRFGGTWIPTSGSSRRASAISRFMSSIVTSHAHAGASSCGPCRHPVRQYSRAAASAISAGSRP